MEDKAEVDYEKVAKLHKKFWTSKSVQDFETDSLNFGVMLPPPALMD